MNVSDSSAVAQSPPRRRGPLLVLGGALIVVVLVAIEVLGRLATVDKVRCVVSGQVVDSKGEPVAGAMVRCDWIVTNAAVEHHRGLLALTTDHAGNYEGLGELDLESPYQADDIKVEVKLQAGAPLRDAVPSEVVVLRVDAVSEPQQTLQLGQPLPTVSLRVVDTAGDPITKIWAKSMPVDGPRDDMQEPRRQGDFDDGVMSIGVPSRPFRIKVQLKGTGRRTVVGPFDPDELPDQIEVVLPDR